MLPEIGAKAILDCPINSAVVGIHAHGVALTLEDLIEGLEIRADLIIVFFPRRIVVDSHIDGPALGATGCSMQLDGLGGVHCGTRGTLFPVGGFVLAELVYGGDLEAVGGLVFGFLYGDGLAEHPFRAGAALGYVSDRAEVAGFFDGAAVWYAGGVVDDGSQNGSESECLRRGNTSGGEGEAAGDGQCGGLKKSAARQGGKYGHGSPYLCCIATGDGAERRRKAYKAIKSSLM
jgi:hypothetical protein